MWNIYFAGMNLIQGFVNFEGEGPQAGSVGFVLQNIKNILDSYVEPIAYIGMLICAIGMMVSRKKGKEEAKEAFFNVLVGLIIALCASGIYTFISNTVSGLSTL